MGISQQILSDLADDIEMGFVCFIHKETFEVVSYPDPDRFGDMETEMWKSEISKIKRQKKKFIQIEKKDSFQKFKVMRQFVDSLENNSTKVALLIALEGPKPFANFKDNIHNSGDYRDLWFAFLKKRNIEWIRNQIDSELS